MDATTYAQGLRELADWLEENESVLRASDFGHNPTLLLCRIDKDEFVETAQALDVSRSEITTGAYLNVTRTFGPLDVQVYIDASKVGESKTVTRPTTEWTLDEDVREALAVGAAV